MANTFKNMVNITGELVDFDLEVRPYEDKKTGEDYNAIVGSITLKVEDGSDEPQLTNLRVFAREKNKSGAKNQNYSIYEKWIKAEREDILGLALNVSTSFSPNAFVGNNGETIENVQVQSNFLNTSRVGTPRSEFRVDVLLTKEPVPEEDREGNLTGRSKLKGEIFDFRNVAFPITFILEQPEAIAHFENLDASKDNPILTEVWGDMINTQFENTREVESAFGDPKIETITVSRREYIITGASIEDKEITEDLYDIISAGKEAYNVYLASVEEKNSGGNAIGKASESAKKKDTKPAKKGFNF